MSLFAQEKKVEENPSTRFEKEIQAFEAQDKEMKASEGAILCVGSSSIRFWRSLKEDMSHLRVINRGFGGSTFADLMYYYDRIVKPYKPKAVLVYEGDNDLVDETMTPEKVFDNLLGFYNRVQEDFPKTKVWFIAIKPSPARVHLLERMQKSNELIQKHASSTPYLEYLDVATPMMKKDGNIREDIFIQDRLHMNAEGYKIWKEVIRPILIKEYHVKSAD
ncbi:MAG: SGNH/GDSL hydrolase family protein [Bacteroidota bacterium]